MKAALFDYELPEELIAQFPPPERDGARMLVVEESRFEHREVRDLCELIPAGALVVLNETRVRRARLFGRRPRLAEEGPEGTRSQQGGGRVELLLLGPTPEGTWRALGRANRPLRPGDVIEIPGSELEGKGSAAPAAPELASFSVRAKEADGTLHLTPRDRAGDAVSPDAVERALERQGAMPIPPYVRRSAEPEDVERYQTVFARELGSVAAPTAGLHLTERALARLAERGVEIGRLVLHVGVGTFRPVTAEDFDRHEMHSEEIAVDAELAERVARARQRGAPVIAIGTTAVRALESVADPERLGHVREYRGATDLLIQPGYAFRVVDGLLTNFHMPKSTLLALVAAFAGRERVLAAYAEAIARGYRFLSYGDAMWLPRRLT